MAQALMRETFFRNVPSGTFIAPRGIECLFEYNGLVMNDRRNVNQIRITRVAGLDDPDVRDTREVNPDRDGETPFASLYGGRTISLQGFVQAGNLDYMRYLWRLLKMAFDDISIERELLLRWFDWRDDFMGENSIMEPESVLRDYSFDTGGTTITVSNGQLVPLTTVEKRFFLTYPRFQYNDVQGYLDFTTGTTGAINDAILVTKLSGTSHIEAQVTQAAMGTGTASLILNKYTGSATSLGGTLTGTMPTLAASTRYWLGVRREGNIMTASFYTADPDSGAAPVASRTVTLAGGDATTWGSGILGRVGARLTPGSTTWRYNAIDFRALNPGDLTIRCKKSAKLDGEETQADALFRRPFMVTLRASSPLLRSRHSTSLTAAVGTPTLTFPGGGTGLAFPVTGGLVFGTALGVATNLGFAPEYPTIRFTGPLTNPSIVNVTNNTRVVVKGAIATGEYLDIDCDRRTVKDHNGANRYDMIGLENTWISLVVGQNSLSSGADVLGGNAILTWRHAFR